MRTVPTAWAALETSRQREVALLIHIYAKRNGRVTLPDGWGSWTYSVGFQGNVNFTDAANYAGDWVDAHTPTTRTYAPAAIEFDASQVFRQEQIGLDPHDITLVIDPALEPFTHYVNKRWPLTFGIVIYRVHRSGTGIATVDDGHGNQVPVVDVAFVGYLDADDTLYTNSAGLEKTITAGSGASGATLKLETNWDHITKVFQREVPRPVFSIDCPKTLFSGSTRVESRRDELLQIVGTDLAVFVRNTNIGSGNATIEYGNNNYGVLNQADYALTIEAWFELNGDGSAADTNGGAHFSYCATNTFGPILTIEMNSIRSFGTSSVVLHVAGGAVTTKNYTLVTGSATIGKTHVALVADGIARRLYVNGALLDGWTEIPSSFHNNTQVLFQVYAIVQISQWARINAPRLSKTVRYTGAFTPPVTYAVDTDTVALYAMTDPDVTGLVDSSANIYLLSQIQATGAGGDSTEGKEAWFASLGELLTLTGETLTAPGINAAIACNADMGYVQIDGQVVAVAGNVISAVEWGAKPAAWFAEGLIEYTGHDAVSGLDFGFALRVLASSPRTSMSVTYGDLTLEMPPPVPIIGAVASAFGGCDRTRQTCITKHIPAGSTPPPPGAFTPGSLRVTLDLANTTTNAGHAYITIRNGTVSIMYDKPDTGQIGNIVIGSTPWDPTWTTANATLTASESYSVGLPTSPGYSVALINNGFGTPLLTQQPNAANGYALIVKTRGGAGSYDFTVSWTANAGQPVNKGNLENFGGTDIPVEHPSMESTQ